MKKSSFKKSFAKFSDREKKKNLQVIIIFQIRPRRCSSGRCRSIGRRRRKSRPIHV